jgi:hypothetical protein
VIPKPPVYGPDGKEIQRKPRGRPKGSKNKPKADKQGRHVDDEIIPEQEPASSAALAAAKGKGKEVEDDDDDDDPGDDGVGE